MKKEFKNLDKLESIVKDTKKFLDGEDVCREKGLKISRQIGRLAAQAIKKIHQGDFEESRNLISEGEKLLREAKETLKPFPEIFYAGFLHNGEKELIESLVTYYIIKEKRLFVPESDDFDRISYLHGLAEAIGEIRRYLLDLIRKGDTKELEPYLEVMDEFYYFLLKFDYQEALTRGLRRTVDAMRGLLERTRSEITLVVNQRRLEKLFEK